MTTDTPESIDQAAWPDAGGQRIVFLLDASSRLERRLLGEWIARQRPEGLGEGAVEEISLPPSRRPRQGGEPDPRLEASLATKDDPLMAPLRIAWLAEGGSTSVAAHAFSLLVRGDPYDPGRFRQWWTRRRHPERCCVIAGEPAHLSDLRKRWHSAGGTDVAETTGLAEFVMRQAALALERAERRVRGLRYKVPRFVQEAILERPAFQGTVARMAWELGSDTAEVGHEAGGYLKEIAATHSPYMIDMSAQLARMMYTRGYGKDLDYDRRQLERIYALAQRYPVVFLPSHKSNLDHLALQYALYENGHPPNHTAGGDNMDFFPIGALMRRSGVFFIRRTFKNNPVYKLVLGHYIDYLVEKRFPLEWYIEGGRSRSGKLRPPRFGMLAYVADAYRRGKSEDVYLLPVSIGYDQIQDVGSYVAEQRGGEKETEGLRWFLRMLRSLRRHYGRIHLRFGEPISLRESMGPPDPGAEPNADERGIELQKLAFDVAVRINRVTPITPTSLVTLAMLATGDRALTLAETTDVLTGLLDYVDRRGLPMSEPLAVDDPQALERTLDALVENGVISCFTGGPEAVYAIGADQHLAAAYYRNAIIHFFVNGAIAELALLRASEESVEDRAAEFWEETLRLRDLLKFEFFFSDKDEYRAEIDAELSLHDGGWEQSLGGDAEAVRSLLLKIRPFSAHLVLRPFLESYRVVGDVLERHEHDQPLEDDEFLNECLGLGQQYHLQKRLRSAESVSKVLFATALRLADNRTLVTGGDGDVPQRRALFAAELRDAIRRVDAIEALAASRRAGLID